MTNTSQKSEKICADYKQQFNSDPAAFAAALEKNLDGSLLNRAALWVLGSSSAEAAEFMATHVHGACAAKGNDRPR